MQAVATMITPKAERYAAQLCKHFAHKVEARYEDGEGQVAFPFGRCTMRVAGEALTLVGEADSVDDLAHLEEVVGTHLERFAFREEPRIMWSRIVA
ncbi:DUF2218 domain-containing protein [Acuticoccus mangrovi]|uniref:DUF2218 domain-containing protein n=1 Tax=Acuticoccus mangrovi TaxID=2796142 RepID=A0A934IP46_9HYPH|nr:DUF2218 domain-containing protein [Acuticoccus mangrovi]MBJ3774999.1 DUF2218 domain-containing protein [Acuticoccus mangrovi]